MFRMLKAIIAAGKFALALLAGLAALMFLESVWARQRWIPEATPPTRVRLGVFGDESDGEPLELAILGDSLAAGTGAASLEDTVGVRLAKGLAAESGRPVRLRNAAMVGAESKDLASQIAHLTHPEAELEVVVIVVGGNEIIHLHRVGAAVQYLDSAVRYLRRRGCRVVVATCPDMGAVKLLSQPLRFIAHLLSRLLATAQTIVVLRAGGRTVSLADTLGPVFKQHPDDMFSSDHLHPSSRGYARAAEVILPSVCAAAGAWTGQEVRLPHRIYRRDPHIHRLAWLAFRAVRRAGSEVSTVPGGKEDQFQLLVPL